MEFQKWLEENVRPSEKTLHAFVEKESYWALLQRDDHLVVRYHFPSRFAEPRIKSCLVSRETAKPSNTVSFSAGFTSLRKEINPFVTKQQVEDDETFGGIVSNAPGNCAIFIGSAGSKSVEIELTFDSHDVPAKKFCITLE